MDGYQMLPQEIGQDDSESESSDTAEGNSSEASGAVNARLGNNGFRGITEADVDRTLSHEGLHTAGGRIPSYMQVSKN